VAADAARGAIGAAARVMADDIMFPFGFPMSI
jgi:hypothetical protein